MKTPHTPFATCLSGSAKETELRLRTIFQWRAKRPPVAALLCAALVALSCGSLVSCQAGERETLTGYITIQDGQVVLDEVEIITQEDTDRVEELGLTDQGDLIEGYFIYNEEESTQVYRLTDKTQYRFVDFARRYVTWDAGEDLTYETTSLEEFLAGSSYSASESNAQGTGIPSGRIPYVVEVQGGTVISITEESQYTF
jgi:hypothetical protein